MNEPEDLDEVLRAKLRAAADQDPVQPRPLFQAQLVQALAQAQRKQRERRKLIRLAPLAAVVAAAALVLLVVLPKRERASERGPGATAPSCALPTAVALTRDARGAPHLDLGKFGEVVAAVDTQLRVEHSTACLLSLYLSQGELAADLRHLKPARLQIRTSHGTVVVRGTRFSVRADTGLQVVLLSGRVEVQDGGAHELLPQQVYEKRGTKRDVRALEDADQRQVAALLGYASRPALRENPQTPPSPTVQRTERAPVRPISSQLLARAEQARQKGLVPRARALYAEASALSDDDAEVALLRWVRLELAARAYAEAERLLVLHRQRFAKGKLKVEAAWLEVVLEQERGQLARARAAAQRFLARFPDAPQADAARALVRR